MKAVTEGAFDSAAYIGVRIGWEDNFPVAPRSHICPITVTYEYVSNVNENNASEGLDFTSWHNSCLPGTYLQSLNNKFVIPGPDASLGCSNECAGFGAPVLMLNDDSIEWEPPELVRMKMTFASTADPNSTAHAPTQENYIGSWVIQDTCESGALFKYPIPLPTRGNDPGLTVQVATTVPDSGLFRFFKGIKHEDHVSQNYPFAASEVVAETSWLEFFIVLMDENAATHRGLQTITFGVEGNLVPAPEDIAVRYKFLEEENWTFGPGQCPEPSGWGATYQHYATQGSIQDSRVQQLDPALFDPNDADAGWFDVGFDPSTRESAVTIPAGETHVALRFAALDNDALPVPTEIAHLHLDAAWYPTPPVQVLPVRIGWSSDFRFLIQDDANCPE